MKERKRNCETEASQENREKLIEKGTTEIIWKKREREEWREPIHCSSRQDGVSMVGRPRALSTRVHMVSNQLIRFCLPWIQALSSSTVETSIGLLSRRRLTRANDCHQWDRIPWRMHEALKHCSRDIVLIRYQSSMRLRRSANGGLWDRYIPVWATRTMFSKRKRGFKRNSSLLSPGVTSVEANGR